MKKAVLVGSLVAALFAGILLVHAAEQQQPQQKATEEGAPAMPMTPQMMMQRMMGMMQPAGVGPDIMRRCQVMMSTPVFLDSPSAIRGQAEFLGLSEEQAKKLLGIEKEARDKAKSVLTEEQKEKMGEIPEKPMAMMEMCQQMMPMMQKMMSGGSQGGPMMMCPMCPMMQMMMGGQGAPQGPGTKQDK